jgi:hypothetical protein
LFAPWRSSSRIWVSGVYLLVLPLIVLIAFAALGGLKFPGGLPTSPLGRVLASGLAIAPPLAASTAVIATTQWRRAPMRPWLTLALSGLAFAALAPLGLMAGMWVAHVLHP